MLLSLAQAGAMVVGTATTSAGSDAITAWFRERSLPGRGVVYDAAAAGGAEALVADVKILLSGK